MSTLNETSTDPGAQSAAEIEREVNASRARVEQTLDQIQDRLSPGQMIDQAVSYFRDGGGGEFTRNLGDSVKQNPMPVALIALGVGWMMLAGQQSRRHDDPDPMDWDDDLDDAGPYQVGLAEGYSPYQGPGTGDDSGGVSGLGERLKETGRDAKDSLDGLGEQPREMGDEARERLARAGRDAAGRARQVRDRTRHHGRRVKQSVLQTVNEQPLLLGAIGLAIGAALGAAVPPTETEDRLMGETRDEALRRAKEVGLEQAEKARDAAGAIVGAAREEAKKQGSDAKLKTDAPSA
jgi:ElaB/YqjD/DUF883 family membrane-anchored ribosome-binding protein